MIVIHCPRVVAQSISYEIPLALCVLSIYIHAIQLDLFSRFTTHNVILNTINGVVWK